MLLLRKLDFLIILFSLSVLTASVFWSLPEEEGKRRAEIEASGEKFIMPLSRDGAMEFEGPVGRTRVEAAGGEVFIAQSDCRDGICVTMGRISEPGEWVACLPNRVIVRVVGGKSEEDTEVDAGAY